MKIVFFAFIFFAGCSTLTYSRPETNSRGENSVSVPLPRDLFWKTFVSSLSSHFFVINNLDKETGLINVSYSGDPSTFVDCGMITVDALGKSLTFPAAAAAQNYEIMSGLRLFNISRKMSLEGRSNIIVQDASPTESRVVINTRYVLNRQINSVASNGQQSNRNDSIGFNYGEIGSFAAAPGGQEVNCASKGTLERRIVEIAQKIALTTPINNP